jgi:glycerol-3-phosphate acyltransferase PlsY
MGYPDPRTHGSKNPGATNVARVAGHKAAVITLVVDAAKGFVPVYLAWYLNVPAQFVGWVGFSAFLGHLFPIFFKFQGGKGVATALGILLALNWQLGLGVLAFWLICKTVFNIVSLSSILAAVAAPLFTYWLKLDDFIGPLCVMSLLLILAHHSNIRRLLDGTEN